jgi:hypothetical protein
VSGELLGDMTPEQRAAATRRALLRFQAELDETASLLAKVLELDADEASDEK